MSCALEGTLFIGFGNVFRGDDGVGVCVAERLRELGCTALVQHQLTPELAESIAAAPGVVFIDADVELPPGEVRVTTITEAGTGPLEHHATPANLLLLAREAYGGAPPAVLVAIGAASSNFGDTLSQPARKGVGKAVELCMNQAWWKS